MYTNKDGKCIALHNPHQKQNHLYLKGAFAAQPQ